MQRQILSRKEAKEAGVVRYFTGTPCRRGHLSEKYTRDGYCVECAITRATAATKSPKYREWRKRHYQQNKAEMNAASRKYQQENKDSLAEKAKSRYQKNREQYLAKDRLYREQNAETIRQRDRENYQANRDAILQQARAARPKHRARDNALSKTKKARKINATPAWADLTAIKRIYERAAELGFHVDHIIPLRSKLVCGLHVETNLRPLPPVDNMKKHNRFISADHEWSFSELARLLNSTL